MAFGSHVVVDEAEDSTSTVLLVRMVSSVLLIVGGGWGLGFGGMGMVGVQRGMVRERRREKEAEDP